MKKAKAAFWSLVLAAVMLISMTACHPTRQHTRESARPEKAEETEELLVFQESHCDRSLIDNFTAAYPHISLKVVRYEEGALDTCIANNGQPDLILGSCETSPKRLAEQEFLADMTELYVRDAAYDSQSYYPGADTIEMVDEKLYAFPLGLETNYLTIRESMWQDSAFGQLPEEYTVEELLGAAMQELGQGQKTGRLVFSGILQDQLYDWLQDSGCLQSENGSGALDQALLEQITELLDQQLMNAGMLGVGNMEGNQNPMDRSGNFVAMVWGPSSISQVHTAPSVGLIFAQSANQTLFNEDIHVLWRPRKDRPGEYDARVGAWGMIGSQSGHKELAYQVIRSMMDMPFTVWSQPQKGAESLFPVNRQSAEEMVQMVEETGIEEFTLMAGGELKTIKKQPLNPDLKERLQSYLTNITYLYESDAETREQMMELYQGLQSGQETMDSYYAKILEITHPNR